MKKYRVRDTFAPYVLELWTGFIRPVLLVLALSWSANPTVVWAQQSRVLVYGDSNSWGWVPRAVGFPAERYAPGTPWPDVLARILGDDAVVVVDALSGRTVDQSYPNTVGHLPGDLFNGSEHLNAALARHAPVDVLVVLLGTNYLRSDLERSPEQIAAALFDLVSSVGTAASGVLTPYPVPRILVVSPPILGDTSATPIGEVMVDAKTKSRQLGAAISETFAGSVIETLDASALTPTSGLDGVHLTPDDHERLARGIEPVVRDLLHRRRISLPEGLRFPNGIASGEDGSIYVGGIADGTIYRQSPTGIWSVFLSGSPDIKAITSLRIDNERMLLWGAAPDVSSIFGRTDEETTTHRIFIADLRTGAILDVFDVPDGGFGNDLALNGDGGIYLTDSVLGRIWNVNGTTGAFTVVAEDDRWRRGSLGPAGIARLPDGNLIVGLFSEAELYRVESPGDDARIVRLNVSRELRSLDGMVQFSNDGLLILEGAGRLSRYDFATGQLRTIADNLAMPANLALIDNGICLTELGIIDLNDFNPEDYRDSQFFLQCFDASYLRR